MALFRLDRRTLELYHPFANCFHISNVLFTLFGFVDYLLPFFGEMPFPYAVPLAFILPPGVAGEASSVGLVMHADFPTLREHWMTANWALPEQPGFRHTPYAVN